ncbi:MAG: TRM11 family SAM-dependent methyltransferase [Bacteroidia bacterium]
MSSYPYIYTFNFDFHLTELFELETRQIFGKEATSKMLFSNKEIDPSISPFIKSRLDIQFGESSYETLLIRIKKLEIKKEGFKAEYVVLHGDKTDYLERLNKLRDVGMRIEGYPDYEQPSIIYSICHYEGMWYFGILNKHDTSWYRHKSKPHSFSNSLGMDIAKSLVCIASKGEKTTKLIDTCCGVGTVMLEACIAGFDIEGCDISPNATKYTELNLSHYNYSATVHCSDINQLKGPYDTAIVDLPYNFYSYSDESITANITQSAAKLASRIVIVSTADIRLHLEKNKMKVIDYCTVVKKGKSTFSRSIWVCEKNDN